MAYHKNTPHDPYRRLAAAVALAAVRDIDSDNFHNRATARTFITSDDGQAILTALGIPRAKIIKIIQEKEG